MTQHTVVNEKEGSHGRFLLIFGPFLPDKCNSRNWLVQSAKSRILWELGYQVQRIKEESLHIQ